MTNPKPSPSPEGDPLAAAWANRDVEALLELMAPQVVLHSPLLEATFNGRPAARQLYTVLFDTLGPVDFVEDFSGPGRRMFVWHARSTRGVIEGTDLLRFGPDGLIEEVRVFIRPLAGIGAFAALTGPSLASRRSRARGPIIRILTLPLCGLFAALDRVAPKLTPMGPAADGRAPIFRRFGRRRGDRGLT